MIKQLFRDRSGAAVVEFAIAAPIVATMMVGILQMGQVMQANGAMRNALGDGIRYAKVHPDATETEVLDETRAGLAGVSQDGISELEFVRGTQNGAPFGKITMQYEIEPVIPFAPSPLFTLREERTSYLPS